ncbi:MAG: tetratricopeptide repeat protein [Selenomonadaceae bacterium]|nr:tetratricopeptide repeat protein [Selenomonadaceae bacterium]
MNQGNSSTNENAYSNDNSIKIYDGVAECIMNDSDNLKNVKIRAKNLAQENVQKKIANYVYSFLKDRYLTFPDDEILSIANEIYNISNINYNVIDSNDNILIRATVIAQIDDNEIMDYIVKCFQERTELKAQNESLRREIEELQRQQINNKIFQELTDHERFVISKIKSDKAWELIDKNDYESAIKLCNDSIQLNQNNFYAYNNRGIAYKNLGQYERAIQDFDKAIKINPNDDYAYNNRVDCYKELGYEG